MTRNLSSIRNSFNLQLLIIIQHSLVPLQHGMTHASGGKGAVYRNTANGGRTEFIDKGGCWNLLRNRSRGEGGGWGPQNG